MTNKDLSLDDLLTKIGEAYKDMENKIGHCNVLVIGKTGVGKSTLINVVFRDRIAETGVGRPVTEGIRQHTKQNYPITVYDTPGLELNAEQVKSVQLEVAEVIEDKRLLSAKEHIHVVWYCINHEAHKFEKLEEDWIKEIDLKEVPVILILTQAISVDEEDSSEFIKWLEKKNLPVSYIIPVLAEPKQVGRYFIETYGLNRLVEATFELLPEVAKKAFVKEQIASIDLKAEEAFNYVTGYVASSAIIGASPIPFSDAFLLVPVQATMLAHINVIFGLPFDKAFIGALLSAIGGAGGVTAAGRFIVTNLIKLIPGTGTVIGGAIAASTAATLTLALGLSYIELLKRYLRAQINGETISLANLTKMFVNLYQDYLQTGRKTLKKDDSRPPREIDIE
ncbi:MAG TPA: GTPase [Leptolyngbyaceae cyanobacterium]